MAGPLGSNITVLLNNGTNLFAATDWGGVYRSSDQGQSWTRIGPGNTNVRALVSSGANLFIGTNQGVLRGNSNGQSLTAVNTGLTDRDVVALAATNTGLFAVTKNEYAVFRSTDQGQNWTRLELPDAAAGFRITCLAANETTIFIGQAYEGPFPDLFVGGMSYSTDNGQSWSSIGFARNTFSLSVVGTSIFAGVKPEKLAVYNINAQGFFGGDGLPDGTIVNDVERIGDTFFAATESGVFRSTNGGQSWTEVNNGLRSRDVRALMVNGTDLFAGTSGGGVFRSTDNGQTWTPANVGIFQSIQAVVASGSYLFVGTGDNYRNSSGNGIFRSIDNGQTWIEVNTGLMNRSVNALAVNAGNLFAGTEDGIFRSTDNGQNWTAVNAGLPSTRRVRALAVSGGDLYAGLNNSSSSLISGGLYRSTDNGQTWTRVLEGTGINAVVVSGGNIFAGNELGRVYRSINNGQSFTDVSLPTSCSLTSPSSCSIRTLAVNGTNVFAGTLGQRVFRSTDNGQTWSAANNGLTDILIFSLVFSNGHLFAGTQTGIFRSTDNGQNWTTANDGIGGSRFVLSLAVNGANLVAGLAHSGVWNNSGLLPTSALASVSAASYKSEDSLAAESIVAAFGTNLATSTQAAATLPLPTELAGTTVRVRDSAGVERYAPLFYVSPLQINYQIPPGTALGTATITLVNSQGQIALGTALITQVAPGLFTVTQDGKGLPAAYVQRFRNGQELPNEPIAELNTSGQWVARPIDLGPTTDQIFLNFFGTGIRYRSTLATVSASLGGVAMEVRYAGMQGVFVGLDQVQVALPRSLAGRGEVDLALMIEGKIANTVKIHFR